MCSRLKLSNLRVPSSIHGYVGRFEDWNAAKGQTMGYQDPAIAHKVASSARRIFSGEAIYERDSVVFDKREFSFPLATSLLWIASKTQGELRVLDFGGGLGTSFFQNKPFMSWIPHVEWYIVEQLSFVDQSRAMSFDHQLNFFSDLAEALYESRPHLALMSSSLQYVEKPYEILKKIVDARIDLILIDRTVFSSDTSDYVTRQHVPDNIFQATIPTWVFSKVKFIDYMEHEYSMASEFPAFKSTITHPRVHQGLQELGYLFIRKGSPYEFVLNYK